MPQNEVILQRTQAGIETVRGTAATVTRKLYETIDLDETIEPLDFVENAGTRFGWYTFAQGPKGVAGTANGPVAFEDLPWWMQLGIVGGVAPTADAGTPIAYTRLYTPNPTSIDDLASATAETGVPDNVYLSTMMMVPEWTIKGDVDGDASWMFTANLLARGKEPLPGGFTAAIPERVREFVKAAGTKLYIDDAAADIGTTQILQKFINFSVTWNNALTTKRFMEDEDQVSTRLGMGQLQVTGQIRLEFDSDAEAAKYRSGAQRSIRIEREGSIIHDAVHKRARIDIPDARWLTPSKDNRENNLTQTFGFRGYIDPTANYPASVESVSDLATLV